MTKEISTANALGARTTRPCDSCIRRRARVYCVADDAFLCAPCDSSVHSANPLARRHQRLPLTSLPPLDSPPFTSPSWTHRKPRTPRTKPVISKSGRIRDDVTHVPDLYEMHNSEEDLSEGNYDDLLYQVPVFDPDLAELYQVPAEEIKQEICNVEVKANQVDGVAGFHISEMDLDEFAADMESLLGGPEFEGLMDMDVEGDTEICKGGDFVENREKESKEMMLKLDYEDVISAWGCKGCSPWTNGERPRLGLDDCWPEFKVTNGRRADVVGPMYRTTLTNEGREARVSRYREKRRTRLFAKKIRYEVRKLNAEKRPRMKGRFVKRASLTTLPVPAQMKMQLPVPVPVMPGHFSF